MMFRQTLAIIATNLSSQRGPMLRHASIRHFAHVATTIFLIAIAASVGCDRAAAPPTAPEAKVGIGDVTAGWEGVPWGASVGEVKKKFPDLGDVDATRKTMMVDTGLRRTLGAKEMKLKMAFRFGKLAGVMLLAAQPFTPEEVAKFRSDLVASLGTPTASGDEQRWQRGDTTVVLDVGPALSGETSIAGKMLPSVMILHKPSKGASQPAATPSGTTDPF